MSADAYPSPDLRSIRREPLTEGVLLALVPVLALAGCGLGASTPAAADEPSRAALGLIVSPGDNTTIILDAIRGARRTVLVEMYLLTASDALAALLDARASGAQVHVLLEPAPYGSETANDGPFATLAAAGVDVRWTRRTIGYVHSKLIVVDDRTAYIMTLNLTPAGLRTNREYAVTDADPADVRWAERLWDFDAGGLDPGAVPPAARLLISPLNARARLAGCIDGARRTVQIEVEELSDPDLVTRLQAAAARGVAVAVVVPAVNRSAATTAAAAALRGAGVVVRASLAPTVHAKVMIVDGRQAYVGSVNFTRASLDDNREVGVLAVDPAAAARIAAVVAADLGAATDL